MNNKFEELTCINVNADIEERDGLKYLSWAPAWERFKKFYPEAIYKIIIFDGKPYYYDENLGYMVMTEVTANGETLQMWLCVMDSKNRAMKKEAYEYKTKYGTKTVEAATMFDINKTIMRCFVKNLAMFGLGLYIYKGEDMPDETDKISENNSEDLPSTNEELIYKINNCKTEEELMAIYQRSKQEICAIPFLLKTITEKGKKLKKEAA